ncbi:oxidoreductase [Salipiger pallidus]|uniref:Oxidoreductase n=1 Tax=Salipiger pallidus TaxID=1775170 RepID=A0A8J2ZKC7_9RHOB|nr:FAD-binding oxidoreductase [Salipiger pallidus]GGG72878.1 oxidoreductase [Salipiger pallidus]
MKPPIDSLWRASSAERVDAPPLSGDVDVDLAVIGGGFTGCSAALEAARRGASVALLEAQEPGQGGSGCNVGLVNAGLWLKPDEIAATLGPQTGRALIDRLGQAPDRVFDIIAREGIACEATRNGTLHCAHSAKGMEDLQDRFRQGNAAGAPLQLLDASEARERTGSSAVHGALFDPRAGTVQPLAYCHGLARAAITAGARLHGQSPVTALRQTANGWELACRGHTVRAGALLLATNAYHEAIPGLAAPAFTAVHYGQFATAPMPDTLRDRILPGGEGCWDTALVMSSFRTDAAGRLVIGGMGNLSGPGGGIHTAWARRKLHQLFPQAADLPFEHGWSGRIAMTSDHVPKILLLGDSGLACFGYSGRGIGPGTVFGAAAAEALLSGDRSGLPLSVTQSHGETLPRLREGWYELGATMIHAASARI